MDLLSVFTSPPVFSVRHGRNEIGVIPDETLIARPSGLRAGGAHVLVLGGRSWAVLNVDWQRRVVQVEPTDVAGVARWSGSGQPLGAVVARGVREVLAGTDPSHVSMSERARQKLAELRAEHPWVTAEATAVISDDRGRTRWWTFAGWKANLGLARAVADLRRDVAAVNDLTIALAPRTTPADLSEVLRSLGPDEIDLAPWITREAVEGLKFSECLPPDMAVDVIRRRLQDPESVARALCERVIGWSNEERSGHS
jgi:ATP-dependent Lhr-like helicase